LGEIDVQLYWKRHGSLKERMRGERKIRVL